MRVAWSAHTISTFRQDCNRIISPIIRPSRLSCRTSREILNNGNRIARCRAHSSRGVVPALSHQLERTRYLITRGVSYVTRGRPQLFIQNVNLFPVQCELYVCVSSFFCSFCHGRESRSSSKCLVDSWGV